MKDLIKRLTSRKLWLAVSGITYGILNNQPEIVMASVVAYVGVEGLGDIFTRFAAQKYAIPAKVDQQTQLINSGDLELPHEPKVIVPGQP